MTIKGMMFDDKKTAGERLILAAKELPDTEPVVLGEYRGFELSVRYEPVRNEQQAVLKGKAIYPVALGATRTAISPDWTTCWPVMMSALPMQKTDWRICCSSRRRHRQKWKSPFRRKKNWHKNLHGWLN